MNAHCQACAARLDPGAAAYICSYECTWCAACAERHDGVCPNCDGELVRRPRRGSCAATAAPPGAEGEPAIREVGPDLPAAVVALFDQYRQFYGRASDVGGARRFLRARAIRAESVILAAYVDGEACGFVQLYPIHSSVRLAPALLLNDLYVAPSARGQGVGRALLDAAVARARADGAAWLMLETSRDNLAAQRLYAAAGWQRDDHFLTFRIDTGVHP